jgi:hypothetical protein
MQPAFTHRESACTSAPSSLIAVGALPPCYSPVAGAGSTGTSGQATVSRDAPAQGRVAPVAPSVSGVSAGTAEISGPGAPVMGVGANLAQSPSRDPQVKDIGAAAVRVRSVAARTPGSGAQ